MKKLMRFNVFGILVLGLGIFYMSGCAGGLIEHDTLSHKKMVQVDVEFKKHYAGKALRIIKPLYYSWYNPDAEGTSPSGVFTPRKSDDYSQRMKKLRENTPQVPVGSIVKNLRVDRTFHNWPLPPYYQIKGDITEPSGQTYRIAFDELFVIHMRDSNVSAVVHNLGFSELVKE